MNMFPYSDYNETYGNRNPIAEFLHKRHKKGGTKIPQIPFFFKSLGRHRRIYQLIRGVLIMRNCRSEKFWKASEHMRIFMKILKMRRIFQLHP